MLGGRPASAALSEPAALADDLLRGYAKNHAEYRAAHAQLSHDAIVHVTAQAFRLVARTLDGGPLPTDAELQGVRTLIADNARSGVPLKVMMDVVEGGVSEIRRYILTRAGDDDTDDLHAINDRIFAFTQRVNAVIPVSYLDGAPRDDDDSPYPVAEALLSGRTPDAAARRHGADVAAQYTVLRCATVPVAESAQETDARLTAPERRRPRGLPPHLAMKAQHDLAEVQRQLTARFGPGALVAPDTHPGLTLIPGPAQWDALRDAVRGISVALGARVLTVADCVPADQVREAADHTRELARLVTRLRYPPGFYTFTDLAVEYQLTRPGPGRDRLAEQLRPLRDNEGLLETLDVHIGNDLDRRRTAGALGLHPNTVDHRLKRISRLTGRDPARQSGLRQLHAASVIGRYLLAPLPPVSRPGHAGMR